MPFASSNALVASSGAYFLKALFTPKGLKASNCCVPAAQNRLFRMHEAACVRRWTDTDVDTAPVCTPDIEFGVWAGAVDKMSNI